MSIVVQAEPMDSQQPAQFQASELLQLFQQHQQNGSISAVVSGATNNHIGRASTIASNNLGAIPEGRTVTTAAPTPAELRQSQPNNNIARPPSTASTPKTNNNTEIDTSLQGAASLIQALHTAASGGSGDATQVQPTGPGGSTAYKKDGGLYGSGGVELCGGSGASGGGSDGIDEDDADREFDDNGELYDGDRKRIGRPLTYKGDPNDPTLNEEERRKIKRRIANRESARRVRYKRQEMMEDLQTRCALLTEHNTRLANTASALEQQRSGLAQQMEVLKGKFAATAIEKSKLQNEVAVLRSILQEHGLDAGSPSHHQNSYTHQANAAVAALSSLAAAGGLSSAFAPIGNNNGMQGMHLGGGGYNTNQHNNQHHSIGGSMIGGGNGSAFRPQNIGGYGGQMQWQ